jgi:hypothetical protein
MSSPAPSSSTSFTLALAVGLALLPASRTPSRQVTTLAGPWHLTLVLDSAKLLEGAPTGDTVRSTVRFGREFRTFSMPYGVDTAGAELGTHNTNLAPFWGGPIPPELSTSVLTGGTTSPITEVFARVYGTDSIVVILDPRFSHGPVRLKGRLLSDSLITGTWVLMSNRSHAAGHFFMARNAAR